MGTPSSCDLDAHPCNLYGLNILTYYPLLGSRFSLLNTTTDVLTYSQKKTLTELQANPEFTARLDDEEKAAVGKLLAGELKARDVDPLLLGDLNDAMGFQRALTGFSHGWDDNGDGEIGPMEQVQFLMDSAAPPTLPPGRILAVFRTSVSVPVGEPQVLMERELGREAADMLLALGKASQSHIINQNGATSGFEDVFLLFLLDPSTFGAGG